MGSLVSVLALLQVDQGGDAGSTAAAAGIGMVAILFWLAVAVLVIAGLWKVFVKAGEPGWAAIIPIYNALVLLKIAGRPLWWLLLMFIPLVNLVVVILVSIDIAKRFGKGTGFGLGLAFLGFIFYPILGFGDAKYSPPAYVPPVQPQVA